MAFDFPTAPANGAEYTSGGITYVWNGQGWTLKGGATGDFVEVAGDTMTGSLTMTMANPKLALNKNASGQSNAIEGFLNGVGRWAIHLGDGGAETGTNTGSNFAIYAANDAGAPNPPCFYINRATGYSTFANTIVNVNSQAGQPGAYLMLCDENGARKASFGWERATNNIWLSSYSNPSPDWSVILKPNGQLQAAKNIHTKSGYGGGQQPTGFSIDWNGGPTYLWIDDLNQGAITFGSDYRIKKDIAPLPAMWDTVKALRPIKYTQAEFGPKALGDDGQPKTDGPSMFIADDIERWGFIAHELQETLTPSAATGEKDSPTHIQSPNPFTIIAALTKTIQEMQTRIEALEGTAPTTAKRK